MKRISGLAGRPLRLAALAVALLGVGASGASAHAVQSPPASVSSPTIAGIARQGETVVANEGGWSGTAPIAFAYQWLRCDGAGASCSPIAAATSKAYLVGGADVGHVLRVTITASNAAGSAESVSSASAVVVPATPSIAPAGKSDCKHGGWQRFSHPSFRNQGQCVSFVVGNRGGNRGDHGHDRRRGHGDHHDGNGSAPGAHTGDSQGDNQGDSQSGD